VPRRADCSNRRRAGALAPQQDSPGDLTRFIDGLLRINEAAQLNDALVSLDTNLERFEEGIICKQRFDLGRDDQIVDVFT
jgi:hypothetical protein